MGAGIGAICMDAMLAEWAFAAIGAAAKTSAARQAALKRDFIFVAFYREGSPALNNLPKIL
jgi:hypothetical protein